MSEPRSATIRFVMKPDTSINMEVRSSLGNAELIMALEDLKIKILTGRIGPGRAGSTLIPGMLTPDLKRVPS